MAGNNKKWQHSKDKYVQENYTHNIDSDIEIIRNGMQLLCAILFKLLQDWQIEQVKHTLTEMPTIIQVINSRAASKFIEICRE